MACSYGGIAYVGRTEFEMDSNDVIGVATSPDYSTEYRGHFSS